MTWNHLVYAPPHETPEDALQRCADLAVMLHATLTHLLHARVTWRHPRTKEHPHA